MTDFQTIQPAYSASSGTNNTTGKKESALSSDFETFLKMLTVQMQNQDPLNPVESSEFAVQLATFSAVEQQVLTNDLLGRILGQSGAGLTQMAGFVGMEVRAPGPAHFDGAPIAVWAEPAAGADQADLVVRDGFGNEVSRDPIVGDGGRTVWHGALSGGGTALHGTYEFDVESRSADGSVIDRLSAEPYSRVIEAQQTPQGIVLMTEFGQIIPASSVSALRGQ